MSAAVLLLSDEGRSVTAIAELLGYSSVEHFPRRSKVSTAAALGRTGSRARPALFRL